MTAVTLLDGGMGQELVHRSGDRPTHLWATQVMIDHPGLVQQIHADYFAAGATVATTNTYALHADRFEETEWADRREELIERALAEAEAARRANGGGRLAGSIGPLVASYRPETHPPHDLAVERYGALAAAIGPRVDFVLCETVASLAHLRAVAMGARAGQRPIWIAVTVDDEDGSRLRSGEEVADAARLAADLGAVAVLANCSAPEAMAAALDGLAEPGLPYGAYANGFQQITKDYLTDRSTVDLLQSRRDLGPQAYAKVCLDWVDRGATIVGGCCEIGPEHIRELARALKDAGHTIV